MNIFESKHTKVIRTKEGLEYIERPEASCIFATTGGKVIMVEQIRGPFGKILEFPAGKVEKGEDPSTAAIRELEEETGYRASNVRPILSYYTSVGYTTEKIHCFFSDNLEYVGEQRLDDNERITIKKFFPEDLYDMIRFGKIKDGKTIMCVYGSILGFDI